jgi:hemoglobin-like flavoprotein
MNEKILTTFDESLKRCNAVPDFLDRFYGKFLASSPKVKEKFADTNFVRQKRALRASLHLLLIAAEDEERGPERYLREIASAHDRGHLDITAELYDYWLDSLLDTVRECDAEFSEEVENAWERVMMVGIHYMLSRYDDPPTLTIYD